MRGLAWIAILTTFGCGPAGAWNGDDDGSPTTQNGKDAATTTQQDASTTTNGKDGGGPSDAALSDDTNYNTASVCTSGTMWTGGDTKSDLMHPGVACRNCHYVLGKGNKDFDISGTVYPSAHEPDDCNGATGVTVVITDANNNNTTLTVNAAGNFYHDDAYGFLKIPMPYTAKVVSGNKVRAMLASQTNGDCNSCHSEQGTNLAPGRIMAP